MTKSRSAILAVAALLSFSGCFAGAGSPGGAPAGGGLVPTGSMDGGGDGSRGGIFVGDGPGAEAPSVGDPTAGNETPMTIVGSPMGSSTKPKDCDGRGFRICFHDVTVTATGAGATEGQLAYDVSGFLSKQAGPGAETENIARQDVVLTDVLFPLNKATVTTGKIDPVFTAALDAAPGRALRLEAKYCHRYTVIEIVVPDETASTLTVDACASPEPTDTYEPPVRRPLDAVGIDPLPVRAR